MEMKVFTSTLHGFAEGWGHSTPNEPQFGEELFSMKNRQCNVVDLDSRSFDFRVNTWQTLFQLHGIGIPRPCVGRKHPMTNKEPVTDPLCHVMFVSIQGGILFLYSQRLHGLQCRRTLRGSQPLTCLHKLTSRFSTSNRIQGEQAGCLELKRMSV